MVAANLKIGDWRDLKVYSDTVGDADLKNDCLESLRLIFDTPAAQKVSCLRLGGMGEERFLSGFSQMGEKFLLSPLSLIPP